MAFWWWIGQHGDELAGPSPFWGSATMGYLYLICALTVAIFIALFAPRAGLVFGAALLVLGALPMFWMLAVKTAFGVQLGESDGMLLTMGLYYLSAPGLMLLVLSAIFASSPWNR